jgi:hypothetical protein
VVPVYMNSNDKARVAASTEVEDANTLEEAINIYTLIVQNCNKGR